MNKKQLKERVFSKLIERVLSENQPATKPKPAEKPGPAVAPGKPGEKEEPNRRKIGNPKVKPNPKAIKKTVNEEEMLNKIVDRFKSKKK